MRDPNRIPEMTDLLRQVWERYPDWRLGQLVCNMGRLLGMFDPFFVEDDKMKSVLEWEIEDHDRRNANE